jgi:hypothetical protein
LFFAQGARKEGTKGKRKGKKNHGKRGGNVRKCGKKKKKKKEEKEKREKKQNKKNKKKKEKTNLGGGKDVGGDVVPRRSKLGHEAQNIHHGSDRDARLQDASLPRRINCKFINFFFPRIFFFSPPKKSQKFLKKKKKEKKREEKGEKKPRGKYETGDGLGGERVVVGILGLEKVSGRGGGRGGVARHDEVVDADVAP